MHIALHFYSGHVILPQSHKFSQPSPSRRNVAVKACLQSSLLPANMVGIHPSEEGRPAGGADLLDVVLGQEDTLSGQLAQGARHVSHRLVVPANIAPPEVVRQHQDDVGPGGGGGGGDHQPCQPQHQEEGSDQHAGLARVTLAVSQCRSVSVSQCYLKNQEKQ